LLTPDEGEILYDGRNFNLFSNKERQNIRTEMGMVFQGAALFDSMTVQDNVMFPLNMLTSQSWEEKLERVNVCLKRVDLVNSNNFFPAELSGGMKKRAAIARAIACNPQYLFCDEPNSGLDPKTALLIDELIIEITHEFDMTTVVNTHDINSFITIGETISYIHKGTLEWRGNMDNVMSSDNEKLNDFIFAQPLTQRIRNLM
ncbi:MAG TPA: ATP-binding cassette domain-containing protein, partial [Bacteroidales bacterium]|nr:ATP-binding cassette domain-containing protein [Bacteroidales bacterium]